MEKRNTLLLTVIAVATLLVAVVGATFAYFASGNVDAEGSNIGVGAEVSGSQATFTAAGNTITMVVGPQQMTQAAGKNDGTVLAANKTENVVLTLNSGAENVTATCTYDLVWTWDVNEEGQSTYSTYVPTTTLYGTVEVPGVVNGGKEFTLELTAPTGDGVTAGESAKFKNFDADTEKEIVGSEINVDKLGSTVTLVEGASITAGNSNVTATWTVDAKIYNLGIDQSNLAGNPAKLYSGKISVANVVC